MKNQDNWFWVSVIMCILTACLIFYASGFAIVDKNKIVFTISFDKLSKMSSEEIGNLPKGELGNILYLIIKHITEFEENYADSNER